MIQRTIVGLKVLAAAVSAYQSSQYYRAPSQSRSYYPYSYNSNNQDSNYYSPSRYDYSYQNSSPEYDQTSTLEHKVQYLSLYNKKLNKKINKAIDSIENLEQQGVAGDVVVLQARLDNLERKFSEFERKISDEDNKFNALESRISSNHDEMSALDLRVNNQGNDLSVLVMQASKNKMSIDVNSELIAANMM